MTVPPPGSARFEPLYTAAEMRAAEERYPSYPDSVPELMERAGAAVADVVMNAFPGARRFACVCGGGSNGGDGRVAARLFRDAGYVADETEEDLDGYDVIVDALFGTGFRGVPRPEAAAIIERMNASSARVVAVDLPSGVDASTGEIEGAAVEAELTVTFHALKVGHVVSPGRFHAGRVIVSDIGLEHVPTEIRRATTSLLDDVPRRAAGDTKYSAGAVLVVGGQPGMTSAACLTALAALRADAGYVTLAVPEESLRAAEVLALEPVKLAWKDDNAVATLMGAAERMSALAIGPGLGRSRARHSLVSALLRRLELPAVIDADGLFGLEPFMRSQPTVLTPHSGELARLLGRDSEWVNAHRLEAARRCAERFGATVLLKGPDTIVASPDGDIVVCDGGPPSLATAGTGDVLTGVVAIFPLERARRDDSCGCRSGGTRVRGGARAARCRAHRERSARPATTGSRAERMTGWSGRASPSTSARSGGTPRRCFVPPTGRSCGPSSRLTATATVPSTSRRRLSTPARARSASRRCPEALQLRAALRNARILVMGPRVRPRHRGGEGRSARARLRRRSRPGGCPRPPQDRYGDGTLGALRAAGADRRRRRPDEPSRVRRTDPAFTHLQIERFREATAGLGALTRHVANSAATLRYAEARFDAVRCGIALYGISPFGTDPSAEGLEPALRWESQLALVKRLQPGDSTGYGRRFVADRATWIGIVPVGYADGFRRDMTGTEVLVEGVRRRVVGTVSMDALAVELDAELRVGTPVTLVGRGILIEEHARVAGTIGYEIAVGLNTGSGRARRVAVDG